MASDLGEKLYPPLVFEYSISQISHFVLYIRVHSSRIKTRYNIKIRTNFVLMIFSKIAIYEYLSFNNILPILRIKTRYKIIKRPLIEQRYIYLKNLSCTRISRGEKKREEGQFPSGQAGFK